MHASGAYLNARAAFAVLARYVLLGPLIGGAPYVWTIIGIPFAYALGVGPALICGLLVLWWLRLGGTRAALPGPWHAAAFGAWCGAVGGLIAQVIAVMLIKDSTDVLESVALALYGIEWLPLRFILPHAVVAGAIMTAWTVVRLTKPDPPTSPTAENAEDQLRLSPAV
ncbi:MAG: hypothetical protein ACRCV9_18395 [Burkholderiaceae bacterium]